MYDCTRYLIFPLHKFPAVNVGNSVTPKYVVIIVKNHESAIEDVIHFNIVYVCMYVYVCVCVGVCVVYMYVGVWVRMSDTDFFVHVWSHSHAKMLSAHPLLQTPCYSSG